MYYMARKIFKFPEEFYENVDDSFMTWGQKRDELRRLQHIANERLQKFTGTEWEQSQIYKSNKGQYDKNVKKMSREEVDIKLNQVYRFLKAKRSTVRGNQIFRAETIRTLHQAGYTKINKRNLYAFGEFMDKMRSMNIDSIYTSDTVVEMFELFEDKGIEDKDELLKNFDDYYENREKLKDVKEPRDKKNRTSGYYRKEIGL